MVLTVWPGRNFFENLTSKRCIIVLFFLLSKYWVSFGDMSFWWSTRFKFIGLFVGWCSFIKSSIGWCDLKNLKLALLSTDISVKVTNNLGPRVGVKVGVRVGVKVGVRVGVKVEVKVRAWVRVRVGNRVLFHSAKCWSRVWIEKILS